VILTELRKDRVRTTIVHTAAISVRIVIADDHTIARNGLRWLVESDPHMLVVGETTSGPHASTVARDSDADVLLLKFPADAQSALDTLRHVLSEVHSVRPIILAETLDTPGIADAVELGARGVILRDSPADVLFNGIRCVTGGGWWIDRASQPSVDAALRMLRRRRRATAFGLTSRELEIIKGVVAGSTNKEIAERFAISENTVKRHLSHIFNKLGASNRVELALFASHHRLV
jgi:two-component system, NarL family, nitrate/nitrite response regulator NarL